MSVEQRWRRPALLGLQLLVGTGLQGKPLERRAAHAFREVRRLAEFVESSEALRLLVNVQAFLVTGSGDAETNIAALEPHSLNKLAQAMCEFLLVAYAEERHSEKAPPEPTIIGEA